VLVDQGDTLLVQEFRRRPPRDDLFKLAVTMEFIAADAGGRKGPIASDYRPNCWFGEHHDGIRLSHDVFFYFREGADAFEDRGTLWVPPGGLCHADGFPTHASYIRPIATRGLRFDVCEGNHVVATATIDDIFDPGPEYDIG
jgi:hypothetical protein